MFEQGKAVPSKLSCAAPCKPHGLQELSNFAATSRSQTGNVLQLLKVAADTFFAKTNNSASQLTLLFITYTS